jgi:protocatechuate 3,4-dioxygenase beta subunit
MKHSILAVYFILISFSVPAQDADKLIRKIESELQNGQTSISKVLADPSYMALHLVPGFREVIRKHAKAEKITIVTPDEPGKKITVKGVIHTRDNKPLSDALIYVYQTSDKGWYSDTAAHVAMNSGDTRHARLFGYLKTDNEGRFAFETIQPKGYPNSDLPAHIHVAVWKDGQQASGVPGELLFDDDPRLTPERKSRSLSEGYLIEKNSGTIEKPVYLYTINIRG